jgi:hypothetical protein
MGAYTDAGCIILAGYLMRDGEKADIVSGTRKVVERRNGYPVRLVIEAKDRLGRKLKVEGLCLNRIANHANPGMFCFMSLTRWDWDCGHIYGEDHDVNP